ncbi:MAG: hypothetical protein IMF11_20280 [Proteobacteria bacterium]|nr:hypothetical protein [Pseudomonadota bacterium]
MNCRQCGTELVPCIVTEMGAKEPTQWKLGNELVWRCPKGCLLNQCETLSKQRRMREKPKPRLPR